MNLILIAFIIGILFIVVSLSTDTIVEITNLSTYDSKVAFTIKWFFYIAILNVIILILIIYYNYYMNTQGLIGSTGVKGYPGSKGLHAPDCVTSYCVKNNTFPPQTTS
jgi:hypothetical protein